MNDKGNISIIVVILAAICIIAAVIFLAYMGYIPSLNLSDDSDDADDMSSPIGSDYCGYSMGEKIGIFENLKGSDLNNDVGYSVLTALNVEICGSNSRVPSEIIQSYMTEFNDDWYILFDDITIRSGYYYRTVIWGDNNSVWNASFIKSVISGSGTAVKQWYDYDTLTATGYGTRSGYLAFIAWLGS